MKRKVKTKTNSTGQRSSTPNAAQKTPQQKRFEKQSSWGMTAQDALHVDYVN